MSVHIEKVESCYGCPHAIKQDAQHRCSYYGLGIKKPVPASKKPEGCKVTEILTIES